MQREEELYSILDAYDGKDDTVVYCVAEKAIKRLPKNHATLASEALISRLSEAFGKESVKIKKKTLENYG